MIGIRFAMLANTHLVAIRCLFPDQPSGNFVFALAWNAFDQSPIGLFGVAFTEGGGQRLRCAPRTSNDKHARCVTVDTMHKTRFFAPLVAPRLKHAINMTRYARTALHGESCGLVEDVHFRVFIKKHLRSTSPSC